MVTENTIQDGESTEASGEPTLADLQAQLEESKANAKKLENDLRSERGQRTKDQAFQELAEDVGGIKARLDAIANRTASGETESLPADFVGIDQKRTQDKAVTTAASNWENGYSEAEASLAEALLDDDDNVLLDKESVAKLSTLWKEAQGKQDINALYRVVGQAIREVKVVEKQKAQADLTETEEAAKAAKKVSDARNGVHDMSVGTPSGGGSGVKSRAQIEKITNLNDFSDEDYAKYIADA